MARAKKDTDEVTLVDDAGQTLSIASEDAAEESSAVIEEVSAAPALEPAVEVVAEEAVAPVEESASTAVKVGDYVETPYGLRRVRGVLAYGLVGYSTPFGSEKTIQLSQG